MLHLRVQTKGDLVEVHLRDGLSQASRYVVVSQPAAFLFESHVDRVKLLQQLKQRGRLLSHLRNDHPSRVPDKTIENVFNIRLNLLSRVGFLASQNLAGDTALDEHFPVFLAEGLNGFLPRAQPRFVVAPFGRLRQLKFVEVSDGHKKLIRAERMELRKLLPGGLVAFEKRLVGVAHGGVDQSRDRAVRRAHGEELQLTGEVRLFFSQQHLDGLAPHFSIAVAVDNCPAGRQTEVQRAIRRNLCEEAVQCRNPQPVQIARQFVEQRLAPVTGQRPIQKSRESVTLLLVKSRLGEPDENSVENFPSRLARERRGENLSRVGAGKQLTKKPVGKSKRLASPGGCPNEDAARRRSFVRRVWDRQRIVGLCGCVRHDFLSQH